MIWNLGTLESKSGVDKLLISMKGQCPIVVPPFQGSNRVNTPGPFLSLVAMTDLQRAGQPAPRAAHPLGSVPVVCVAGLVLGVSPRAPGRGRLIW